MNKILRFTAAATAFALLTTAVPARAEPTPPLNLNAPGFDSGLRSQSPAIVLPTEGDGSATTRVVVGVVVGTGLAVAAGYLTMMFLSAARSC